MSSRSYHVTVTPSAPEADIATAIAASQQASKGRHHSSDFATVFWDGQTYRFGGTIQRAVIAVLWNAWENGQIDILEPVLLEEAGSYSARIVDLFKGHAALDRLIVRSSRHGGPAGGWRLAV